MTDDADRLEGLRTRVVRLIRERTGLHEQFALPIAAEIIETFRLGVEAEIVSALRPEFHGERVYVASRDPEIERRVVAEFTGQNRDDLLRKYGISRATFYRYTHNARARRADPQSKPEFSI